jgi:hypothetical protein
METVENDHRHFQSAFSTYIKKGIISDIHLSWKLGDVFGRSRRNVLPDFSAYRELVCTYEKRRNSYFVIFMKILRVESEKSI